VGSPVVRVGAGENARRFGGRVVGVTGARMSATWLRSVRQWLLIILEPAGSAGAC
jgi:hypothetical protein